MSRCVLKLIFQTIRRTGLQRHHVYDVLRSCGHQCDRGFHMDCRGFTSKDIHSSLPTVNRSFSSPFSHVSSPFHPACSCSLGTIQSNTGSTRHLPPPFRPSSSFMGLAMNPPPARASSVVPNSDEVAVAPSQDG